MNRKLWLATDGADCNTLLDLWRTTVVAFAEPPYHSFGLPIISLGASIHHIPACLHAHHGDVCSSLHIVESTDYNIELFEELHGKVTPTNTTINLDYYSSFSAVISN